MIERPFVSSADEKLRQDSANQKRVEIIAGNKKQESLEKPLAQEKPVTKREKEQLHDRVQEMRTLVDELRSDKVPANKAEIMEKKIQNTYHKQVREDLEHALEFPDDFSVQEVSTGLSHLAGVFTGEMRGAGLNGMNEADRDESNERMQKARGLFLEVMGKMMPDMRSLPALQKDLEKRVKENPNDFSADATLQTLKHLNDPEVKGVIRYNVLQNGLEHCAEDLSVNAWNMIEYADSLDENPSLVAGSESQGLRLEVARYLEIQRGNSAKVLFGNAANRIEDLQQVRAAKTTMAEQEMEKK